MGPFRLTGLAFRNLAHDPRRLTVSVAGVAFAVVLISMELGFRNALLDSMVELINRLKADVILYNASKSTLAFQAPFNRRVLDQVRTLDGVARACPFYIEAQRSTLRTAPADGARGGASARTIRVLAVDPDDLPHLFPELVGYQEVLKQPDTALFDARSKRAYGLAVGGGSVLARRPVRFVGRFTLGADLANDGNLITSAENYLRYFPGFPAGRPELRRVELGLLQLEPGADAAAVADRVARRLKSQGVKAVPKAEFIARERAFWESRTPIGAIFSVGAALGLVVGGVICYQILFSDIADHLAEYATLKAMGYGVGSLINVVLQEALFLAVAGFLPGIALSALFYRGLAEATGLLMALTPARAAVIFGLTVLMCLVSGLFAVRKVLTADPAELF